MKKKNHLIMSPNIFWFFFFLYKPNYYNSKFPKSELLLNIKFIKNNVCLPSSSQ